MHSRWHFKVENPIHIPCLQFQYSISSVSNSLIIHSYNYFTNSRQSQIIVPQFPVICMFAFNNRWVTIVKHIMVCFYNSMPLSANGVFQKATEKVKTAVKLGSSTQQTKPLVDIAGYGVSVCNSLVCLVSFKKTTFSTIVCLCL